MRLATEPLLTRGLLPRFELQLLLVRKLPQ
jgi:hypothetical protein